MIYYKMIGDSPVFSECHTIQMEDGSWISNPSAEEIAAAGWSEYIPPVVPRAEPELDEVMQAIKRMLSSGTEALSDEDALNVAALYPTWASRIGQQVEVGERLWYDGKLYKVIQPHVPQEDWHPDATPALYTEVSIIEWPEWIQPTGAQDAYAMGDKVSHNGQHWVSTMDANVYEPGVYGWDEQL